MVRKIMLFGLVLLFARTSVFAFGLPAFGKSSAAPSNTGVSAGELKGNFDKIIKSYNEDVSQHYTKSNELALSAFGLKQESEKLKAENDQMGSGVTADGLAKISAQRNQASALITEKIKSGEKLTLEGKKLFGESMLELGKGLLAQPVYVKGTKDIGQAAAEGVKKANPMDLPKYNEVVTGTATLGELIATDANTARNTLGIYTDYAKSNQIDVPPDVTKVFESK
jgi:hypothetical protein